MYHQLEKYATYRKMFKALGKLRSLNLTENRISTIDPWTFEFTTRLVNVSIAFNRLSLRDENFDVMKVFRNCPNLTNVDLSRNNIVRAHFNFSSNSSMMKNIDLSHKMISVVEVNS